MHTINSLISGFLRELDDAVLLFFLWAALIVGPIGLSSYAWSVLRHEGRYLVGLAVAIAAGLTGLFSLWFFYAHGLELVRTSLSVAGLVFIAAIGCIIVFPLCLLGSQIRAAVASGRPRYVIVSIFGLLVVLAGLFMLFVKASFTEAAGCAFVVLGSIFVGFLNHFFVPDVFLDT